MYRDHQLLGKQYYFAFGEIETYQLIARTIRVFFISTPTIAASHPDNRLIHTDKQFELRSCPVAGGSLA